MKRPGVVLLTLGIFLAVCPVAQAQWVTVVPGAGAGGATSVGAGSAPTPVVSGRTVSLSWPGGVLSNGASVPGYVVKRYDSAGTNAQTIASGSCTTLVAGTGCSETSLPTGTWRYSVTPAVQNWRGTESNSVSVVVGAPSISISNSITPAPTTLSGSISTFADGDTITFHLDGTGGTELSATVAGVATPAAVPTGGSAAVTISLPGGTSEGPHTIHAVGLGGDSASYPITVDSTAPPVPSITSAPLSPTSLTDATLQFNDTEPGVTFYCQFDSGGFTPCTSPVSYSSLSEGPHSFQVRAHDAAGNQSFLATANWTVDTTLPTAAISFPLTGGIHNGASYNAGCGTASTGDICGSASDTGTGVTSVQVSIRQGSGNYHDGTGFSSPSETWLPTTGTTPWTHAFAATAFSTDGSYTVRARSSDAAGNISMIATESFTIDLTGPAASDIQINNGGATPGAPELGDTVVFTFSEPMTPASILSGWNGGSTTVIVRLDNSGASDTMAVYDSTNSTPLNLGTVGLLGNYVTGNLTFGLAGTASTMTVTGSTLTITLGTASGTARTVSAAATAQWTPSATATDVAGNAMSTSVGTEQGTADPNF